MAQLFGFAWLLLLALTLAQSNASISRQAKKLSCFEPQGSPVRQMKPFKACGMVIGIVESESEINYMPLAKFDRSTNSCFEAGEFEIQFWIDWCHNTMPKQSLLMLRHIQDVDSFDTFYIFYGCSQHYRTKFMLFLQPLCPDNCLPLMSYTWNRSDLPPPYAISEKSASQSLVNQSNRIKLTIDHAKQQSIVSRQGPNQSIILLFVALLLGANT